MIQKQVPADMINFIKQKSICHDYKNKDDICGAWIWKVQKVLVPYFMHEYMMDDDPSLTLPIFIDFFSQSGDKS